MLVDDLKKGQLKIGTTESPPAGEKENKPV